MLEPFELQPDLTNGESGWTGNTGYVYTSGIKDINGNGSNVSITNNAGGINQHFTSPDLGMPTHMVICKGHFRFPVTSGVPWLFRLNDDANSTNGVFNLRRQAGGTLTIHRQNTQLAASGITLAVDKTYLVELEFYMANSGGTIKVWVDGVLAINFTGDTRANNLATRITNMAVNLNSGHRADNLTVDIPTISYDGGTGSAPVAGNVITDGTTGASATICGVDGDATSGRLSLCLWNGTAFGDNNTISGSGFSASVNAPTSDYVDGFEPFSFRPGNEHIVLAQPNANGNSSQLTGSDGNSVDNYLLVNDSPPDSADYVESTNTSAALKDTYGLDFSNVPGAGFVSEVTMVAPIAQLVGDQTGVNNANLLIRQGSTDYEKPDAQGNADDITIPISATCIVQPFDTQPDGSGAWDRASAVALEAGVQLKP